MIGICLSRTREPAPSPPRHSSMTTPRSLSISAGSRLRPPAKSDSAVRPRSHDVALVGRQVEHVDRFVEARVGVDVRPQPGADSLEVADELARLEVGAAVERHVLDEVREALLVVRFLERPRLDRQAQRHALFRPSVAPDEVFEAVRQRPGPDRRVERQNGAASRSAEALRRPAGPGRPAWQPIRAARARRQPRRRARSGG